MLEEKYKKLKNSALIKAIYLSVSSLILLGLALVFILAIKIIPLALVIILVGVVNWMLASNIAHQKFMIKQQEIIEEAFKEKLKGFKLEIGGNPKEDMLKTLDIPYAKPSYLPSFVLQGSIDDVKITAYSASYKTGMDKDYTYARIYKFTFKKKPYALNLEQFDSPIVGCSINTETKYTNNEIYLHFANLSSSEGNIYSLFLNKYANLDAYLKRLDMELAFFKEVIEIAKD